MDERKACDHLKRRFEAAGFKIAENVDLDEDGIRFAVDGFDAERRVGYEYVTAEAGDGWDVDETVKATLADRHAKGDLHILVIDEAAAPDAKAIDRQVDAFLATLKPAGAAKPAKKPAPPAKKKPAAKAARKVKRR
jgi:hypothetical protein